MMLALHRTEQRVRPRNEPEKADRVAKAAEAAPDARHFVSAIDIFVGDWVA
jgi:hypothetical protein